MSYLDDGRPVTDGGVGEPLFCVLGVDQSTKSSGWCFDAPGYKPEIGLARDAKSIRGAVQFAAMRASALRMQLIAVVEDHGTFGFGRGNMSVRTLLSMGSARGFWEQELACADVECFRVEPNEWRPKILGVRKNCPGDAAKLAAQNHAAVRCCSNVIIGADEAEALCIAEYGRQYLRPSPPKRSRRTAKS